MNGKLDDWLARLELLGRRGFVISIAYGHCGNNGLLYSVNVLSPDGQEFSKPYVANSFGRAVEIAEIEIEERGWTTH